MTSFYRTAILCGACPLVTGVAIFLLWLVTRWDLLMVIGMLVIPAGFLSFLAGSGALSGYLSEARRASELSRRTARRRALGAGLLLLVNFPAAYGIILAVSAILTLDD
jgi:hypothetical protein